MGKSNKRCVLTGMGIVCSLGTDLKTACAAARAGVNRANHLDYFEMESSEGELDFAVGHAVPFLTEGFEGSARLLRLAQGALSDLTRQTNVRSCDFYLSLPGPNRCSTGLDLIADRETRESLQAATAERQKEPDEDDEEATFALGPARLLSQAAKLASWSGEPILRFVSHSGHTGVAEALSAALADLDAGAIDRAVVGGVDSLLDEDTLNWLAITGRLKSSTAPAGLQPGEGAAFLLLETLTGPTNAPEISGIELADESRTQLAGDIPAGTALAEVLHQAIQAGELPSLWVLSDQNGEPFRAADWGHALVRLKRRSPNFEVTHTWYPAISFGDTGAASGALSLCLVARALERAYAPAGVAVVANSSDASTRSAILLTAA